MTPSRPPCEKGDYEMASEFAFPRLSRRMRFRFWWRRWRNGECRHGVERRDGAWCADCEGMETF